jgi:predicted phosphodiesterase
MNLSTRTKSYSRPSITFQYLSDLHIENNVHKGIPIIKKVNHSDKNCNDKNCNDKNCMILAGDIGDPSTTHFWEFIKQQCLEFDHVIFVCGNHEFYRKNIQQTIDLLDTIKKDNNLKNFHVLHNDTLEFDNCTIIGSTLWSYTPPEAEQEALACINDYKLIEDFYGNISSRNKLWYDNVCFIQREIEKINRTKPLNHKIIVVTHHAPELENTSHPRHSKNILNYSFACDLKLVVNKVDYWVFGHTHFNGKNGFPGTLTKILKSNQVGYYWDSQLKYFDTNKHFIV